MRKHPVVQLLLFSGCVLLTLSAHAWGRDGHRITAEIASANLTPEARAAVSELLGAETMAEVSTWADEIRRAPEGEGTAPLHYLNIKQGQLSIDLFRDARVPGNVLGAIVYYSALLRAPSVSPGNRAKALKFLIHFVGDVHQPMHVSHAEDRGGNGIKVKFFGKASSTWEGRKFEYNLHGVWDSSLIERDGVSWQERARRLTAEITGAQRAAWIAPDAVAWARESYAHALERAYDAVSPGDDLGQAYFEANLPVIEERLQQGGIRLAGLLNGILGE